MQHSKKICLQQLSLEETLKSETLKNFYGAEVYLCNDIIKKFGSYITGIHICIVCNGNVFFINIEQFDTTIKDIGHYICCTSRIKHIYPHLKYNMIYASKTQPKKELLDIIFDHNIYNIIANDQTTLTNNILFLIHNILCNTDTQMDIC